MIVKNEAHVIARCLASVRPIIDHWMIVDTGSTDGTREIIRRELADLPGTLVDRPWVNFGYNRTQALRFAEEERTMQRREDVVPDAPPEGRFDFILFIDADETLHVPKGFQWPALTNDAYHFDVRINDSLEFKRNALVRAGTGFRWEGVLHEYLTRDTPHVWGEVPLLITSNHDGARGKDPTTYLKDVALLEEAVAKNPESARDVFYLAQSYRDAGMNEKSIDVYKERVELGGWAEEVWYSLFQIAILKERMELSVDVVQEAFLEAYTYRPSRAEPLVELSRYLRERRHYVLAALYARQAALIPYPNDELFIDAPTYKWRALDELSISGFYAGETYRDVAKSAARRLVNEGLYPAMHRERILRNHQFYQ